MPLLNGCYAWVGVVSDGTIFAAVDRLASIPLFYGAGLLTDSLRSSDLSPHPRWFTSRFWVYAEALPGCCTLDDRYLSLAPGQAVCCSAPSDAKTKGSELESFYWLTQVKAMKRTLKPSELGSLASVATPKRGLHLRASSKADLGQAFTEAVLGPCRRLVERAAGRRVIVLLSDGYDSRLLLVALHQLGCPNLMAATYGLPGSKVVAKAQLVAQGLGVPWHFIDYSVPE
ncbi:MAG: hypothetical protein HC821_03890, partial [Lewinella sp.]|nr:hypothetical protein [Lewinella sp.]